MTSELTSLELCHLSATDQLAHFASRELSPLDVLEAQIGRHGEVNGAVNAVTDTHFDSARAQAIASAERYRRGDARPLEGLTARSPTWC